MDFWLFMHRHHEYIAPMSYELMPRLLELPSIWESAKQIYAQLEAERQASMVVPNGRHRRGWHKKV